MLPQKSLASSSIRSVFVSPSPPISCVPGYHQKELKSSTAEKVFFFFRFHGRPRKSFSFGSKHSLDTTMGAAEVHSLGYYTVVFVSCDSVRVDTL